MLAHTISTVLSHQKDKESGAPVFGAPEIFLDKDWLDLLAGKGGIQCVRDAGEVCYHACGLAFGIVLSKGDEVVILAGQKLADILRRTGKGIVGGNGD